MSATVPQNDPWSRLNLLERRIAALERVNNATELSDFVNATLSTTSATMTTITGQPATITADIGASGDARITVGGYLQTSAVDDTAYVGLSIDGAPAINCLAVGDTAGIISATTMLTFLASEITDDILSPGPHTFDLAFMSSTSGHAVYFSGMTIMVKPI